MTAQNLPAVEKSLDLPTLIVVAGFAAALFLSFLLVVAFSGRQFRMPVRLIGRTLFFALLIILSAYWVGIRRAWDLPREQDGNQVLVAGKIRSLTVDPQLPQHCAAILEDPTGSIPVLFTNGDPPAATDLILIHGTYHSRSDSRGFVEADWRLSSLF